ncbi:MAG: hypothetical protein NXI15_09080 [Gammaproteobacteria bacterium]|nr:hypothetical protein [Gammaproteobacteria bacterium]
MDVTRTIKPGQPGSKRFQRHWGDRLVAVRYRQDRARREIYTTIEIIVDTRDIPPENVSLNAVQAYKKQQPVAVTINWDEVALRQAAKKLGARWSQQQRVWVMRYSAAETLALQSRVTPGLAERCADVDISLI